MNKHQKNAVLEGWILVVAVTAMTMATAGCSSDPGDSDAPEQRTTRVSVPAAKSPSPSPTGPTEHTLKGTAKWDDISIKLSNFHRGRSTDAGVPEEANYVRFTVTTKNESGSPFNLSDVLVRCTTQEVYDGTQGLGGGPDVHALPGKSVDWDVACLQYKDKKDFQVEINPQYGDSRTAIFAGDVG